MISCHSLHRTDSMIGLPSWTMPCRCPSSAKDYGQFCSRCCSVLFAGPSEVASNFTLPNCGHISVQWRSRHIKSLETLCNALPQLHNLTTFNYCEQKFGPTLTSISSLASSSPSLTTLELNTVFFSHDALTLFCTFSGLHRLLLRQPEGTTLSTAPKSKRALSLQCVANLILACHETLNYLELPGEFCPLESLASGSTPLSALKTLILHGYPPLDAETIPVWKASASVPRLTRLEVLFRLRVVGARANRYVLMPSDVSYAEGDESIFPSQLQSLSIANPMMKDHVFKHLPSSLKSLTLDFIPEWENMLSSKDSLAYHRPERMLDFLANMTKKRPSPSPDLESLCIKMGWCATPEIFACIHDTFPDLIFLEFQGLRYVDRGEEDESDMNTCVSSLAGFGYLQTLKLAMELPEDTYEYSSSAHRNVGSVKEATQRWADALALRLPNLRTLAFEIRPHVGRGLGPRILLGQPDWAWFDIRSGTAKRNLDMVEGPSRHHWAPSFGRESRHGLPQAPPSYQPR